MAFFPYFRDRAANARALADSEDPTLPGPKKYLPEAMTLATAGLDQLAAHWSRVFQVKGSKGAIAHHERMARFLEAHGSAWIWDRVAVPHLFRGAASEKRPDLVAMIEKLPDCRTSPGAERSFEKDVKWSEACRLLGNSHGAAFDEGWFGRFRYGSILYYEYRNAWVHVGEGPGTMTPMWESQKGDRPWYANYATGGKSLGDDPFTKRVLMFPPTVILDTFVRAIDSFEVLCTRDGVDPCDGFPEF